MNASLSRSTMSARRRFRQRRSTLLTRMLLGGMALTCGLGAAACAVEVSTAGVAEASMAFDAEGTRSTTTFEPTDAFFVAGRLAHAPAGTRLQATWVAVEVEADGVAPNLVLKSTELEGGTGPFHFQLTNDTPWPNGRYRVELAVNGTPEQALEFSVRSREAAAVEVPATATPQSAPGRANSQPKATSVPAVSGAKSPRPGPQTILAESGDHVFRQAQLDQGMELIRFLSGSVAGPAEEERLRADALRQFHDDPVEFAQGMSFIDEILTAARSTADPFQISGYRVMLFNSFYALQQQLPVVERPALLEIVFEKNRVLAFDPATQLVLTEGDLRSAVQMLAFGEGAALSEAQIRSRVAEFESQIAPQFASMPLESKQTLASATVLWEVLSANLDHLTAQQVAALRSGYATGGQATGVSGSWSQQSSSAGVSGGGMDARTAAFLSRLSLEQHVSTMNAIENMGGTGNYWELTPAW